MSLLEQTKLRPMGTMPFKRALPMRSSQEPCDSGSFPHSHFSPLISN